MGRFAVLANSKRRSVLPALIAEQAAAVEVVHVVSAVVEYAILVSKCIRTSLQILKFAQGKLKLAY